MSHLNSYDVTTWPHGDAATDIGEVLNSIITDIKARQTDPNQDDGGKPGAVIYIPPGDYHLRTQVRIDISYLQIKGSGHGFTSSSIRFNIPADQWPDLHELWPGGSRILVDLPLAELAGDEAGGAAFLVERSSDPRISSVEFSSFCIDGMHFTADGSELQPENTYVNGKVGIYVASPNDSFRINEMGFIYLEQALIVRYADALSIHDNFVAECGSCVELRGWGQASKVTDNLIGAGFKGHSIYAENHGGLLIAANNIFPRGKSCIHFDGVTRSSITANRLHSFYPGMVVLDRNSSENLIASNHLLRDQEPWAPFTSINNGRHDSFGLLQVNGDSNSIIANHISEVVDSTQLQPAGAPPVIVRLVSGTTNYVASNHTVARDVRSRPGDSAFEAQVDALLMTDHSEALPVITVLVDPGSIHNTILDSGTATQIQADQTKNALRLTPSIGSR